MSFSWYKKFQAYTPFYRFAKNGFMGLKSFFGFQEMGSKKFLM